MLVHRISRTKYIEDLSGEGARLYGGRWNKPGTPALYTAQHKSLALLELIVHFNSRAAFRQEYSFISLEIPDDYILEIDLDQLPTNFEETNNRHLWSLGERFFQDPNYLAMKVPSVLVSKEFNFVLNPLSKHFHEVKRLETESAFLDTRFLKIQ